MQDMSVPNAPKAIPFQHVHFIIFRSAVNHLFLSYSMTRCNDAKTSITCLFFEMCHRGMVQSLKKTLISSENEDIYFVVIVTWTIFLLRIL